MKKIIISWIIFIISYCILVILMSPFLVSWGTPRTIFGELIIVFIVGPLDWGRNALLIVVNGCIWGLISHLLLIMIQYIKQKFFTQ